MPIHTLGAKRPQLRGEVWIAESAFVIGDVVLEDQASVWYGSILRGDNEPIIVGAGSNIQDNSVLHTDPGVPLTLGRDVTIGHQVMLHGCSVGDGTLIGIKSVVMNHAVIGKNCLIGANSLVAERKVIPDRSLVLGSPGRIIRTLTDQEVANLYKNAASYVANWQRYRRELGS